MADSSVQMPSGMGGLMRYSEEYETKFSLKPTHVIGFIILVIVFRIGLSLFLK